jgi:hypothetical protein
MQMTMSSYTGDNPLYFEDQTFAVSRQDSANWLAGVFSRAGIDNLERQTARFEKLKKKRRDRMISSSTAPHRYTDEPGKGLKMVHTPTRPHTPPAVRLLPGCTYIFMEVKFNAMATFLWLPRGSHSSGGVA